jgi:hypothetical protein
MPLQPNCMAFIFKHFAHNSNANQVKQLKGSVVKLLHTPNLNLAWAHIPHLTFLLLLYSLARRL